VPYVVIDGFRSGLDKRRHELAAPPGVLTNCINMAVTRGGDLETRKGLGPHGTLPAGTHGLHALGDLLVVFTTASVSGLPPGVVQRVVPHPTAPSTPIKRVLCAESFGGDVYAIIEYDDGKVYHWWGEVRVTELDDLLKPIASNADVLNALAAQLQSNPNVASATVSGNTLTVTMADKAEHTAAAGVEHLAEVTSGTFALTAQTTPVADVAGAEAVGILTMISRGDSGAREMRRIDVYLDSVVDLLGYSSAGAVVWNAGETPEDMAGKIRDRINSNIGNHGWTATTVGNSVWFSPPAGTYAAGNGITVKYVKANIRIAQPTDPAVGYVTQGGRDPVVGVAQTFTFTIGGTFNDRAVYWLELDGVRYTIRGFDNATPRVCLAHANKMFIATGQMVYFSALQNARRWLGGNGAGFIVASGQAPDTASVTALAQYRGRLVVFQRRGCQIWNMPEDERQAALLSKLSSMGRVPRRGFVDIGGGDLLFITDTGIRSLRTREMIDAPFISDIGSPIDELVVKAVDNMTPEQFDNSIAAVEPTTGQIWFVLGPGDQYTQKIFVLSYYPEEKISAWAEFIFTIDIHDLAVVNGRLYVRSGDEIYVYGGYSGQVWPGAGVTNQIVSTPWMSFGRPGDARGEIAVEVIGSGTFDVTAYVEPDLPNNHLAPVSFDAAGKRVAPILLPGRTSHLKLEFTSTAERRNIISQVIVHGARIDGR
jgi:hypothetical protein